jgi:hypothetical protein
VRTFYDALEIERGKGFRQGMTRKLSGIPSFSWHQENDRRLPEKFCRHNEMILDVHGEH